MVRAGERGERWSGGERGGRGGGAVVGGESGGQAGLPSRQDVVRSIITSGCATFLGSAFAQPPGACLVHRLLPSYVPHTLRSAFLCNARRLFH